MFDFMFIAHKDNILPSFWEDSLNFSAVELISFSPWFMCEVPQFEKGSVQAVSRSTHLIGDVLSLHQFAKMNEIEKTYMVTPANLNNTENWSIKRLKSISKAIYQIDDYSNVVYRFETETGDILDYDAGGFARDVLNLKFDAILNFN